jgi:hypothetical protein
MKKYPGTGRCRPGAGPHDANRMLRRHQSAKSRDVQPEGLGPAVCLVGRDLDAGRTALGNRF